ncbi:hypothetical protein HRbin01_01466 [archaeon HR01]|nr:hypothetical protein HRbin01_01466 [archaeon HR01]
MMRNGVVLGDVTATRNDQEVEDKRKDFQSTKKQLGDNFFHLIVVFTEQDVRCYGNDVIYVNIYDMDKFRGKLFGFLMNRLT